MDVSGLIQANIRAQETGKQTASYHKTYGHTLSKVMLQKCLESTGKSIFENEKQVQNVTKKKDQLQTDHHMTEPEEEQDVEMEKNETLDIEEDEELSVISSNVSPHDSDFDLLQINTDADFSLLMPSPQYRSCTRSGDMKMMAVSPSLSFHGSTAPYSPSKFFKCSLKTSVQTFATPQHRDIKPIRPVTSKEMSTVKEYDGEALVGENYGDIQAKQDVRCENVVSTNIRGKDASTLATPPHIPAPSGRRQLLSCCLKNVFDQKDEQDDRREVAQEIVRSPAQTSSQTCTSAFLFDTDDTHCTPSKLLTSPSENDSFFSFANSLSPLVPADEYENSLMPMKLSPLVPQSYEVSRLLPPFPKQESSGDRIQSSTAHALNGTSSVIKTPSRNKPRQKRGLLSAAKLLGGDSISSSRPASGLVSPSIFADSFPNIQASTRATPGQDERLKLGDHSVMRIKLHTSFGSFPSLLDSHLTRKIQAINNSLKRKKCIRRRKAEEKRHQTSFSSNVQRKLLQTPVKFSAPPRTITRSPLHPWNGQTSQANTFKTPTRRKLSPSQQSTKVTADEALLSSPVARKLISATDPIPAPATPVSNNKKRKASQCVSMPSSVAKSARLKVCKLPLDSHQTVVRATTPVKQAKQEVTTSSARYSLATQQMMATCDASDIALFGSNMFTTPTPVGSMTSLMTALQSTSKADVGPALMMMPSQLPKKAPCNCKKSKCLKLYCECFRLGGYCDNSCNCFDCANTTETEEMRQQAIALRLEKNPYAFELKIGTTPTAVTSGSAFGGSHVSTESFSLAPGQMSFQQQQQKVLSLGLMNTKMHKHGCHCKKSACQKKYCECFQAGVPCGDNCRCMDCKNQILCVAHSNGVAVVESTLCGTPSHIANELDETFVSPVLHGARQRMRIDLETEKNDFLSQVEEIYPGRNRDQTEWLDSRLFVSTSVGDAGTWVRPMPFTSGSTPEARMQTDAIRSRATMSPIRGLNEEQRSSSSDAAKPLIYPKERELQQYHFAERIDKTVRKAALSAVVQLSAGTKRVFVLPLFGEKLPPLENDVSATIFCYLTNADLQNASLVNYLWNQVALGDIVWDHANYIPTRPNVLA